MSAKFNPITGKLELGGTTLSLGAAFQGVWDVGTSYLRGQAVSHQGTLYVCLQDHSGTEPPDAARWDDLTLRGPVGATGPRGDTLTVTAGATLGGHRAVILNAANQAIYADSSTLAHAGRVVGLTLDAATSGDPVTIQLSGALTEPAWSWDSGQPVYVGAGGALTQFHPVAGFSQIIGFPTSGTSLFIALQPPVILA